MGRRILFVLALLVLLAAPKVRAQNPPLPASTPGPAAEPSSNADEVEFKKLVAQVLEQRSTGNEGSQGISSEEQAALRILDTFVLDALNAGDGPKLEALNQRLSSLVTQNPPVGQGYAVLRVGGSPPIFALAANFGSSGPSAARFYMRGPEKYGMVGRIDPAMQADYFDDYLQILPLPGFASGSEVVFVTVTGRTDEFATGVFAAWRLTADRLQEVWVTDLLSRSSYEVRPDGFQLTYCAEPDEERPGACQRMTRERYIWDGAWKRVEQVDVPASSR